MPNLRDLLDKILTGPTNWLEDKALPGGPLSGFQNMPERPAPLIIPANPGPNYLPVGQGDAETMQRALQGATVNRARGIAQQMAAKQMQGFGGLNARAN
jgi:hypothetical protein